MNEDAKAEVMKFLELFGLVETADGWVIKGLGWDEDGDDSKYYENTSMRNYLANAG